MIADPDFLDQLYKHGVFVAFGLAAVTYIGLSLADGRERAPAPALAD